MKTDVLFWQYLTELFLEKSFKENPNTHFVFNKFFSENRAFYGVMGKNMVEP